MEHLGRGILILGIVLVVAGAAMMLGPKIPYLGKLPGDIHINREHVEVYIPLATSLLVSLVLSGLLWLISYFGRKGS